MDDEEEDPMMETEREFTRDRMRTRRASPKDNGIVSRGKEELQYRLPQKVK